MIIIRMLLRQGAAFRRAELARPRAVRIADLEICDYWHEDGDYEPGDEQFGQSADERWFATYDIYLVDDQGGAVGGVGWADLESFLMHYPICSPAMKQNPPRALAEEMRVALIQDRFDEASAVKHLTDYLSRIGTLPALDLVDKLKESLYFLPKGKPVQGLS